MTSRKLPTVLAILCGSFVIYCGQSAMNGGNPFGADGGPGANGDGSFVGDAKADGTSSSSGGSCCTVTPQAFTNIAEGDLPVTGFSSATTPSIDVSAYREVVVLQSGPASPCVGTGSSILFKEPNSAVFASDGQPAIGRVRVDGPSMQLSFTVGTSGGTCSSTIHYVVAGVGLN